MTPAEISAMLERLIVVDFETYYAPPEYSLTSMTTADYVRDPRFETIGVGFTVPGKEPIWYEHAEFVSWARGVRWEDHLVLAHNTPFDGFILSERYGVRPGYLLDTLSMARALHPAVEVGGSLSKLMEFYKVGKKGDEVIRAMGKRRADFTTEEWLRYGEYCKGDVMGCLGIFIKMLSVFPGSELDLIDTTLRMFTEPRLKLNTPLMEKYLVEERARKTALLQAANAEKADLMSNPKFAAKLVSLGVVPPMKVSKTTGEETFAFAKSDPGMQALLEHENDEVRVLAEARVGVKSTINETRTERLLKLGRNGASLPVFLKYAGAHTHRWSGGDKLNWQNFQRGGTIRQAIEAPEGHLLVVADSAQIEARVVAWLAEHVSLIEMFAQGRDVYSEFASAAYGRPIDRKKNEEDKIPGFVGKCMVLGLGYGMGWLKFAISMQAGMLGGPRVTFTPEDAERLGVSIGHFEANTDKVRRVEGMPSLLPLEERIAHCAVAEFFVQRYRRENAPITGLWSEMEQVIQGMSFDDADFPIKRGNMRIVRHGLVLPNGLILRYPGLAGEDGDWSYLHGYGKTRSRLYGGLMTENVVQALARIIVADQMQALREKFDYRPVTMTHDEIVLCIPEAEAETTLGRAIAEMKTPPAWAPDLPLNAEGGIGKQYGEAK